MEGEKKVEPVEAEKPKEERCLCYSVEPPKTSLGTPEYPWRSTYVFNVWKCQLCGRRTDEEKKIDG